MRRTPPRITRNATLLPSTTLLRSEGGETIPGGIDPDQPRAHRNGIRVIVLACKACGQAVGHQRAADRRIAVGGDRDTDAGPAQRHAPSRRARSYRLRQPIAIIGINDRLSGGRAKKNGRRAWRERVWSEGEMCGVAGSIKKK